MIRYSLGVPLISVGWRIPWRAAPFSFFEQINVACGGSVNILHQIDGAVLVLSFLAADIFSRQMALMVIFVLVGICGFPIIVSFSHKIAVLICVADVLMRNRPGKGNGSVILLVVGFVVGILGVVAVPDGADKFSLDGWTAVRPICDVDDRFFQATLNDIEDIAANEHIYLPLG